MSVNRYDDALNEFEQNWFILGSQACDTLVGDLKFMITRLQFSCINI